MANHVFVKSELQYKLNEIIGKTFGEVDKNRVFDKAIGKPKITGIAGDIIEGSVLEYPSDNEQSPDLIVDGIDTELKVTGLRKVKSKAGSENDKDYRAKEGITITAVSAKGSRGMPPINEQVFEDSALWHKMAHMLYVFYHYNSYTVVPAYDYSKFKILGYHFHEFSEEDKKIIENDWIIVKSKVQELKDQAKIKNIPESLIDFGSLTKLRSELMYFDLAPKSTPRFRLKKDVANVIIGDFFNQKLEKLSQVITSYSELDNLLHEFSEKYRGKTLKQIAKDLKVTLPKKVSKNIVESIITKYFGSNKKKLRQIEIFSKIGLIPKSIKLDANGKNTEDVKFDKIDFVEWFTDDIPFDQSIIFNFFYEHKFLFMIFKEVTSETSLVDTVFLGFKRYSFSDEFIEDSVKEYYEILKNLVRANALKETSVFYMAGSRKGQLIKNKKGTVKTSINFPKSKKYHIFNRGSGTDSTKKNVEVNGIKMYTQYFWVKGSYVVDELSKIEFL